ncbi:MAG TPA: hypothetical protein VHS78_03450 [Candidatus Elarobacter sp.]|nr:hypothetical protein [Candidatus Elarobacter sp.]
MKRLVAASALAAVLLLPASFARASSQQAGGAQIQWTAAVTASLSLVTEYGTGFTQGNATPTLLPSAVGVCGGGPLEANFTISFGALTPASGTSTGCLYKNALAIAVQSNDAAGFSVNQYLDFAPGNGFGFCAYPNGGATFPLTPAVLPVPASARSGSPAAGTFSGSALTSCGGGGVIPQGTGGASSGGTVAGNPGTPGLEFYSPATNGLTFASMSGPTVNGGNLVTMYAAEDVQANMGPGTHSVNTTSNYITLEMISN